MKQFILTALVMAQTTMAYADKGDLYKRYQKKHAVRVAKLHRNNQVMRKKASEISREVREAFIKEMQKSNPREYKILTKSAQRIANMKVSQKEKNKMLSQLQTKHSKSINRTLQKLSKQSNDYRKNMKYLANKMGANLIVGTLLEAIFTWFDQDDTPAVVDQEFNIEGNYDFDIEKTNGHLLAILSTNTDLEDGYASATGVSLYAGGFSAEAGVAKMIDIPNGYDKLKVILTTEVDAYGFALSLGGISSAGSSTMLEVLAGNFDDVYCSNVRSVNFVLAPLLWSNIAEVEEPVQITCEVDLNGQAQSVLVASSSLISGFAAVAAGAVAGQGQTPYEMTIQLINE